MGDTTTTAKIGKRERRRTGREGSSLPRPPAPRTFLLAENLSLISLSRRLCICRCAERERATYARSVLCSCSATLICIPPSAPPPPAMRRMPKWGLRNRILELHLLTTNASGIGDPSLRSHHSLVDQASTMSESSKVRSSFLKSVQTPE